LTTQNDTWTANEPLQFNGKWECIVIDGTRSHACHLAYKRGAFGGWSDGTHRSASAAYGCAEREAARRNK
jgi:hypothetical protein